MLRSLGSDWIRNVTICERISLVSFDGMEIASLLIPQDVNRTLRLGGVLDFGSNERRRVV